MSTGSINVSVENIFPLIKKFLYSDHEIFLRELISNATDATTKLKHLTVIGEAKVDYGNPIIEVKIDKEAKTLTITDHGLGMTGEEVEKWPYEAAQGHFGTFYCKRLWSVEMTPAAAFTFFFDPDILREVNPIVNAIKDTKTLQQAEEIIMKDFNLFPETRLPVNITAPIAPQIPD